MRVAERDLPIALVRMLAKLFGYLGLGERSRYEHGEGR